MKRINFLILLAVTACNYNLSGQAIERWDLDTVIISDTNGYMHRVTYTYNNKGYLELETWEQWDTNKWIDNYKYFYTYDANGNKLTDFSVGWSKYRSQWDTLPPTIWTYDNRNNILTHTSVGSFKIINQYDTNNNNIETLKQNWENDDWENTSLNKYQYNNNNCIYALFLKWENNQWDSSQQITYKYNTDNKQIESLTQKFENSQWKNVTRSTRVYDKGNLLESENSNWSDSVWTETSKSIYTYDGQDNRLTYITRTNGVNKIKHTYTYDGSNNMLSDLTENWRAEDWDAQTIHFYAYDEENNILMDSVLNMGYGNVWVNSTLFRWEYDENSNAVLGVTQKWGGNVSGWQKNNKSNTRELYYNNMQSKFQYHSTNFYKLEASYQKIKIEPVGIGNYELQNTNYVKVYPNPARSQFTVTNAENTNLSLYNIVGQKVLQTFSKGNSTEVNIGFLPQGIYVLKVVKEGNISVHKIIISD